MDEVFGEENFQNEIIWRRSLPHNDPKKYGSIHDSIFYYRKTDNFTFNPQYTGLDQSYIRSHYNTFDKEGRRYQLTSLAASGPGPARRFGALLLEPPPGNHWRYTQDKIDDLLASGRIVFTSTGRPRFVRYMDEMQGPALQSLWTDIRAVNSQASERLEYPTQKPEELLERIIKVSSNEGDIVMDAFCGSGNTLGVAEKMSRRWVGIDCGKLAIYTVQKRLYSLTKNIGAPKKDDSPVHDRIPEWNDHIKSHPGLLLITEKAKKGECNVTIDLLADLAKLIAKHDLLKKGSTLSIACPEDKLHIPPDRLDDADPESGPGEKCITIDGQEFRISLIAPKEKAEKEKPLPPKEFALYRAGLYDMEALRKMPWQEYRPFVLKLFGVREDIHSRYGMQLDGYIGTHSTLIWNYPDHPTLTLDYGYVENLHQNLRGRKGERFYVIAPTVAMDFAEDEREHGGAIYAFLKVPISVIMKLIQAHEPGALKQPMSEADVNNVIDAIGFDFISQPVVRYKTLTKTSYLFPELVVELKEFRAKTLTTDPEDFANFETFSMAMVDLNYDGDVFRLDRVFWGEELLKEAGGLEKAKILKIRIPEQAFKGEKMMVILCDRYGNEKTLVFGKGDFL